MTIAHIDEQLLTGYCDLSVTSATAAAIEAHLMTCAVCRGEFALVATGIGSDASVDHDRMWDAVLERVDRPRESVAEKFFMLFGIRDATAKVLAATPALRASWLVALALVAGFAAIAGNLDSNDPWLLLVLAPLAPLAGVATAFGPRFDPTHEIGAAAPFGALRLAVLRSFTVLLFALPILAGASLMGPLSGWIRFVWLLPALAVVSTMLALSTWISLENSAVVVGATWIVSVVVFVHHNSAGDFVARSMIFSASGQVVVAVVATAGLAVVAARQQQLDLLKVSGR